MYMGDNIDDFRELLAGYKATINIARSYSDANLYRFVLSRPGTRHSPGSIFSVASVQRTGKAKENLIMSLSCVDGACFRSDCYSGEGFRGHIYSIMAILIASTAVITVEDYESSDKAGPQIVVC